MQPAKSNFWKIIFGLNFILCFTISCKKSETVPQNQTWTQTQTTDFNGKGRQNAVTFSIGSKGYVGLGNQDEHTAFTDMWEFNPTDKSWAKKTDFPGTPRLAPSGFYIGNKGYVVNGLCGCNDFWEYDPANDKWTRRANFPMTDVYYTATFVVTGKGYVGTGILNSSLINDFWEYDPALDQWSKKADFPGASIDAAGGFAIADKGYIVGGNLPSSELSNSLWAYDPAADKWTQKMDCPFSAGSPISFSMNSKGYAGMGFGGSNQFWTYTPGTDSWTKTMEFMGDYRAGIAAFEIGNTVYIGLGTSTYTVYRTDFWEIAGN